ncbi:MAG: 30S ribosomal protein S12 methylthiotransferase RimO [Bacteroidales bacterium]|nr:30S ribosomal protein S12 methylthiotransferase RimO [Bacteroidales bacterium]
MKTKSKPHRIGLVSLGCAKNLVDSELLMKQLEANNYEIVFDPVNTADIDTAIINTCGFINDAKQESIDTILQYVGAKQHNKIGRVYVMGCLSERYTSKLQLEIPEVDAFFGVNDLRKIINHIGGTYKSQLLGERKLTTPSHYAYLKIAEGCDRKCSFCAIPMIRGKHVSRPMEEIVSEASRLVQAGVKEINIISQDTTYYGLDLYKKRRLPELLDSLADIEGLEWIRLHYTYPDGFPPELLDVVRSRSNICNYIDIPLQHISDRILKSMHRGMDGAGIRKLVDSIREAIPGVAIRTTLIAGYPGETEKEFRELRDFIEEYRFDRLGVFSYSHEEDTRAFKLRDSISEKRKTERVDELMSLQESISHSLNQDKVGQIIKVLVDRCEGEFDIARSEHDSPEVDNEVLIHNRGKVLIPGSFCNVKINRAESFDLYAELQ